MITAVTGANGFIGTALCVAATARLIGSLQVDISETRAVLGWKPPVSVDEGLKITVAAYLNAKRERV